MTSVGSSLKVTVMFAVVLDVTKSSTTEEKAVHVATWMTLKCFLNVLIFTGD
jgi:hypothetical protein